MKTLVADAAPKRMYVLVSHLTQPTGRAAGGRAGVDEGGEGREERGGNSATTTADESEEGV